MMLYDLRYERAFAAQASATARMSRQQRQQQQQPPRLPWVRINLKEFFSSSYFLLQFLFRMEMGSLIPSSISLARLRQMPTTRCLQQKVPQGKFPKNRKYHMVGLEKQKVPQGKFPLTKKYHRASTKYKQKTLALHSDLTHDHHIRLDTTTEFDDGRPWIPVDHDPPK